MSTSSSNNGWTIEVSSHTDVGKVRKHNEDNSGVAEEISLYVVADGMGGHRAGELASAIAVESLVESLREHADELNCSNDANGVAGDRILEGFRLANQKIIADATENADHHGMGTTMTAILVQGSEFWIGHVGDSRAFRVRDGQAEQLTLDHSVVAEQVRHGVITEEQAHHHPLRSVLTRSLGTVHELEVDLGHGELQDGDVFLIASDGLTNSVDLGTISETAAGSSSVDELAANLVAEARERDGSDNITAVVLACHAGDGGNSDDQATGSPETGDPSEPNSASTASPGA